MKLQDIVNRLAGREIWKKKQNPDNPLFEILGARYYREYIGDELVARLEDLVGMGKLNVELAREARQYIEQNGELPCDVRVLDDVVSGRTIRGIGNLMEIEWYLPREGGDRTVVAKSFLNSFANKDKYEQAYLAQTFFHYLVRHVRETLGDDMLEGIEVLRPGREKNGVFLSNLFLDGETMHNTLKYATPEEAESHLAELGTKLGELRTYAAQYEEEVYALMRDNHERVPKGGIFAPVNHEAEFADKVVRRIMPEVYERNPETVGRLEELFHRDIAVPVNADGQEICHRDCRDANVIMENGVYTLIDFEFSGLDSPASWIMPSLFKSEHYGIEDRVIDAFGTRPEALGQFKIKDNLLWAGRYYEWSELVDDEVKDEMLQLASYRFSRAVNGMRAEGLDETADYFASFFEGKLRVLPEEEMASCEEQYKPLTASTSITKTTPDTDLSRIKEIFADKRHRRKLAWGLPLVFLAGLSLPLAGGLAKRYQEPVPEPVPHESKSDPFSVGSKYNNLYHGSEYIGYFRRAFKMMKTRIVDENQKAEMDRHSPKIKDWCEEYGVPVDVVRNMMDVSKTLGNSEDFWTIGRLTSVNIMNPFEIVIDMHGDPNYDVEDNVENGIRYLGQLMEKHDGNMTNALYEYWLPLSPDGWVPDFRDGIFQGDGSLHPNYGGVGDNIQRAVYCSLNGIETIVHSGFIERIMKDPEEGFPTIEEALRDYVAKK